MNADEAAQALEKAKADLRAHDESRNHYPAGACIHDWMDGMGRFTDAVREAERKLSASRNEEYAEVWDGVPSLRRAPLPRVFHRDRDRITVLAAVIYIPPEWNGKIVGEDLTYSDVGPIARIEFRDARLRWSKEAGSAIERHPLYGRGVDPTRAMRVVNSRWTGPGRHHLLMFESAALEILGSPDPVEVWTMTLDEASSQCGGRLDPGPS
jgi:hypothetical protein